MSTAPQLIPESSDTSSAGNQMLAGYKIAVSHQEVDRILTELQGMQEAVDLAGGSFLPLEAIGNMLCSELGYEDMDEFEDALHGTFKQFLEALPNVDFRINKEKGDREEFHLKAPTTQNDPFIMTLKVKNTDDLWRVLMQGTQARIVIPELEFEIGSQNKVKIDTIYNHIGTALFNLEHHAKVNPVHAPAVKETVDGLRALLDGEPFTIKVVDPMGQSAMKPDTGVKIVYKKKKAAVTPSVDEKVADDEKTSDDSAQ